MANNEQRGKDALKNLERELNARDRKEKSAPWTIAAISAVVLLAAGGGIYMLANQDGDDSTTAAEQTSSETTSPEPIDAQPLALARAEALPETVSCSYPASGEPAAKDAGTPPTDNVAATGTVTVNLDTSAGPIGMELDRAVAPCTVNSIEYLASTGYFDGTVCHRMTTNDTLKVLQCGDPSGTGSGGPGFTFANEYPTDEALEKLDTSAIPEGLPAEQADQYKGQLLQAESQVKYERGTIAMANAGLNTNGSQFFLNYGDSTLAPSYTYFGKIDEAGLETLDKVAAVGVEGGQTDGAPAEEVKINTAKVG